jgi:hypothetical protein
MSWEFFKIKIRYQMMKFLLFVTIISVTAPWGCYLSIVYGSRLNPPPGVLSNNAGNECSEDYINTLYNTTVEILEEFYYTTGGDFWIDGGTTWTNKSQSYCLWGGISCDHNCNIVLISIVSNNLTGIIPRSFSSLHKIREIDLSYNHLTKGLNIISLFPELRKIFISNNELYEPLPVMISNLVTDINLVANLIYGNLRCEYRTLPLRTFIISNNTLSGTIPIEWKNLTQLSSINLSNNNLEGAIPDIFSDTIYAIDLSHNNFDNLPDLADSYPSLTQIYISHNKLQGTIPETWMSLTSLEILYLDNNHLSGDFSSILRSNYQIRDVRIFNNNFSGSLPKWYINYNLITFYASNNNFSGLIHPPFEALSYLDLRNNSLLIYSDFGFFSTQFGTIYDDMFCPVLTNENNLILVVSPEYYQYKFCHSINDIGL